MPRRICNKTFFKAISLPLLSFCLGGCVQPVGVPGAYMPPGPQVSTQAGTIDLENQDRIMRFRRLANLQGIESPQVDQLTAPPGSVPGVVAAPPVVRVVFNEDTFFATGSDIPQPQSAPVFDLIAENMRRDVPDAALTILGHTDATGSDVLNVDLSRRRAAAVMAELIRRGVPDQQMDSAAIGKSQPIASNLTAQGRARNRRVEFMISGSDVANLAVISHRTIYRPFLQTAVRQVVPRAPTQVAIYRPEGKPQGSMDFSFLKRSTTIALATPSDIEPPDIDRSPGHVPQDIEPPQT